jgi:zinc and cadmium transporter
MHPALLLACYCLLCIVASLSGGWVPLVIELTHRRMQIAISFVSGVVLGIGLLHLLPHSFFFLGSIDATMMWVLAGFLFMFFLERFFHFHHHEPPDELAVTAVAAHSTTEHHHHDHDHDHGHGAHRHAHAPNGPQFSWSAAAVGLTLHALIDGVTIAAAVKAEDGNGVVVWAGLGAALAVVLHKPFDSLTIGTLMAAAGRSTASRHLFNALYSLITPLGVALFYLTSVGSTEPLVGLGQVLGFSAGAFICIATSDLLPELQFHHHDRTQLSLALVAGIALAWASGFLETGGHDHGHDHGHAHGGAAEQEREAAHDHGGAHDHDHDHK